MTRNKKIALFLVGIVALFGFSKGVNAAPGASLTCDKTNIKVGESTLCTVTVSSDSALSAAAITLETSEYLDISNVKAATSAGWALDSQSGGIYKFKASNTSGVPASSRIQLFSFNLTLNEKAKNLSAEDSCGNICISNVTLTDLSGESESAKLSTGSGNCFSPTVELCVGSGCEPAPTPEPNPETGEFMNYAIIGITALIALIAILIARRGNKFYTM